LTFDHAELLARVDNDRELLHELPRIFKEEYPRHLQALREAVDSGDAKLVSPQLRLAGWSSWDAVAKRLGFKTLLQPSKETPRVYCLN